MTQPPFEPLIKRRTLGRVLTGLAVATAVVFFLGVGGLVWAFQTGRAVEFVRQGLVDALEERCELDAAFTEIRVDPIERQVQLSKLVITDPRGEQLLGVEEALLSLELFPLFYGRFQLSRVALLEPEVGLEIEGGAIRNLPACLTPAEPRVPAEQSGPLALGIDELNVERGHFDVRAGEFRFDLDDIGVSITPGASGGTDLAVGVDDGVIHRGDQQFVIQRLRLLGHLGGLLTRPRNLALDSLEAELEGIGVQAEGTLDFLGPVFDVRTKVELPLSRITELVPGAPQLAGEAAAEVQVSGGPLTPRLTGLLRLTDAEVDGRYGPFARALVRFTADREGLRLDDFDIQPDRGRVTGSGSIGFGGDMPIELDVETDQLSLGALLDRLGVDGPWVDLQATGPTRFEGQLRPFSIEGPFDFEVASFFVSSGPFDGFRDRLAVAREELLLASDAERVHGRWRFDPDNLTFENARVEGEVSRGVVDARIGFKQLTGQDISVRFERLDFSEVGPIVGVPVRGQAELSAELVFRPGVFGGTGRLKGEGLWVADVPLGKASARVNWDDKDLTFEDVEGRLGDTKYRGRYAFTAVEGTPSELDVDVEGGAIPDGMRMIRLDPRDWGQPEGTFSGRASLRGPFLRMTGPIDLTLGGFTAYGERFQSAEGDVSMEGGVVILDDLRLRKRGHLIAGAVRYDPFGSYVVQARMDGIPVTDFDIARERLPSLRGVAAGFVDVEGTEDELRGAWGFEVQKMRAGELQLGSVRGDGAFESDGLRGDVRADGAALGAAEVSLELGLLGPDRFALEARLDDFAAVTAVSRATGVEDGAKGRVTGTMSLRGSDGWSTASGRIDLSAADLGYSAGESELPTMSLSGPARIDVSAGVLRSSGMTWTGPDLSISVEGRTGVDLLDARLRGRLGLSNLERLMRSAERASGRIEFDAALVGTPTAPGLVGTARVRDGSLQWAGIVESFNGLEAELDFSRNTILVDQIGGRWAGGALSGRGSVQLGAEDKVAMFFQVERARPRFVLTYADIVGSISGDLALTGSLDALALGGDLVVRRPLVEPRVDLRTLVGSSDAGEVYDPGSELLEFDVGLDLRDSVRVRSELTDLTARGELRYTGTNQRPGLLGTVAVEQGGRVTFLARDYTVNSGVVEFEERYRFSARYDMSLSTEVCSARITVGLSGDLDAFDTTYSSTPDMDQRNIVSCLIRGIRIREFDDERAIGAFAGSTLLKLSGVDQEVKKVIPVDQIDVTTEFSSQAREYQPRLLVAKDLSFLDRSARLEYSSSLVQTSDQRAAVRLRLAPRLNLQLGWTSSLDVPFGDWGVDLKHRWEW